MDAFDIRSGKLHFVHDDQGTDMLLERAADAPGTVVLDFAGAEEISQVFGDEVFRVFHQSHPGTKMLPVNMTTAV